MIDIAILLLINSALCFGFYNACLYEKTKKLKWNGINYLPIYEKGVLWFINKWANNYWFYKPLCGCPPCMASIHSFYPYWLYNCSINNITFEALAFYPVYVLALSGLNYLIDRE